MTNRLYQLTENEKLFEHNKKRLPGLEQISSLDEMKLDGRIFLLKEDESVFDSYRATKIYRVDNDVNNFFKAMDDIGFEKVFIPVSIVNYHHFPVKMLSHKMELRMFDGKIFSEELLAQSLDSSKRDKKTFRSVIYFTIYNQIDSPIEIGKSLKGNIPKLWWLHDKT